MALEQEIPGFGHLHVDHLVLDYNGTLAVDGRLLPGVAERLRALAPRLSIVVVTADTFGGVREELRDLPVDVRVLAAEGQDVAKRDLVIELGAERCIAIGNGRNDRLMLEEAAVGVAVLQREGASSAALAAGDVVTAAIQDALDLLLQPLRLVASLRC
jgi:soluble P-type ATPase